MRFFNEVLNLGEFWMNPLMQKGLMVILIILWFIAAFLIVDKILEVKKEIKEGKRKSLW